MSETKFTPGPWYGPHMAAPGVACDCRYVFAEACYPGGICEIAVSNEHGERISDDWNGDPPLEQAIANAHLIAAAPELYEALEAFVSNSSVQVNHPDQCDRAEAVLAKARGESLADGEGE